MYVKKTYIRAYKTWKTFGNYDVIINMLSQILLMELQSNMKFRDCQWRIFDTLKALFLKVFPITRYLWLDIVHLDVWERRIQHVVDVALVTITEYIARTVTSGNVSHPEDEAMGSLVFWSAIRALILVSPEDLEADPSTDKTNNPFGQFKRWLWKKKKSIDIIHRATKSCVPDQTAIAKTVVYEKENWE